MKEERLRRRTAVLLMAAAMLMLLSPQTGALSGVPDKMVLSAGEEARVSVGIPVSAEVAGKVVTAASRREEACVQLTAGEEPGTAEVIFRLLGLVPVKTMQVTVQQPRILVPGGRSLGVAVQTQGVVVVGASDLGNFRSPAHQAGIRAGDIIRTVDGVEVNTSEELSAQMADGEAAKLGVIRDGEEREILVEPVADPRDGAYRLGVWVRESTAGVGTLTYYDPQTHDFGALGHAITDADTGVTFPVSEGAVYRNEIVQITKGSQGVPGELTGAFFEEEVELGGIERNTEFGVFGSASESLAEDGLYPQGLPVGTRDEIHAGSAQILTTAGDGGVCAYDCEIEKLYRQQQPETRSMIVRITDPELLARTGGIVQGMSGSPIVQDGKLVGAVTHVLVSDPTRGYGVYIEWMLDAAA